MKTNKVVKSILMVAVCFSTFLAKAQEASVEETTYGIQTGLLGIWAHREEKLTNQIALREEIGFDGGFWSGSFYPKNGFLLTPVITLEPRWYYNLNKRVRKGRNIDGNSGNYLSLKTSYHPNWFVISNYDNVEIADQISFVPTWGIRRNVGKHFTYETGIGIGYQYIFAKSVGYQKNEGQTTVNLNLRLGYRF
ncbi:hypothetical protein [Flavobacterium sp. 7A]|uniref:hypothetical protein n=1 Tax=Flavobacterium sp. 7A TaxID=2940571 RepID=UPI002225F6E7|nr:hypothetical protein [Flavobacterium sp. 7A]MCW2120384.1 hypothetical protein [Flavobacterium sp. 7A]